MRKNKSKEDGFKEIKEILKQSAIRIDRLAIEIAELKESQKKTDSAINKLRESQKKTDEQLKKTDEQIRETGRLVNRTNSTN